MGEKYVKVRVRELTAHGDWPWRYIVEGLRAPFWRKRWPWSKQHLVSDEWIQFRHSMRDYRPMQSGDAYALAEHYRREHKC